MVRDPGCLSGRHRHGPARLNDRDYLAHHGWITVDEAAKAAGISTRTIRRWIHAGMPSIRVKGRSYVRTRHVFAKLRDVVPMS